MKIKDEENKKMINKSEIATTSYPKIKEIDNKKIGAIEKKSKSICHVKFNENLNLNHSYSYKLRCIEKCPKRSWLLKWLLQKDSSFMWLDTYILLFFTNITSSELSWNILLQVLAWLIFIYCIKKIIIKNIKIDNEK